MKLRTVNSTNISQIGFEENRISSMNARPINVLRIIFTNGSIYDYMEIEKQMYLDLMASDSKGKFLWKHIKDQYMYEKVK